MSLTSMLRLPYGLIKITTDHTLGGEDSPRRVDWEEIKDIPIAKPMVGIVIERACLGRRKGAGKMRRFQPALV